MIKEWSYIWLYNLGAEKYRHSTTLSGHLWELKDQGRNFKIDWAIIEKGRDFNPITGKCDICLKEKFHIIYNRPGSSLNKREEIFNTCRHRKRKLLGNAKTWALSFPLSKEIKLWKQLWKQFLSPEDRNTCLLCETIL